MASSQTLLETFLIEAEKRENEIDLGVDTDLSGSPCFCNK
jgi:hypothetical protein